MTANCCQLTLLLMIVLGCMAWTGCRPQAKQPLAAVLSGDVAGWIAPCGCTTNQSGGLARRAAYLAQLRQQSSVFAADVGGTVHGDSAYDRLKLRFILAGETAMGTTAHNIGAAEARLGAAWLREQAARGTPFISANVRDRAGQPVVDPLRIVHIAGRRVALIGVLAERYATGDLDVAPPDQAVLDALRTVRDHYDAVILLAYLPEDELRHLAATLPEVDVIVGGPTGQPLSPQRVGSTLLTSATSKGKFVVRLDAPGPQSPDRWTAEVVELNERFSDDPSQVANLDRFRAALLREDFSPKQTSFAEPLPSGLPSSFAVAGSASCGKCHDQDCRQWRQSKHAVAWRSLEKTGSHVDPECQRCHATGYGLPGGFTSLKDDRPPRDRVNVGCESCHGPSQAHVADTAVHTAHFTRAKDFCTSCHDRENSPKFDFDNYWKRIEHGKKP
ncbi:MAG: hypothetical protein LLG00_10830 [Planctomycetaceae bacterium]|nr:hypothetical protein [Planctomycetaceae bacterium]